jgi:RHS repeat-associated protein
LYGSEWDWTQIPADQKVPLLTDHLTTTSEPKDTLERAQVHLSIEPEIYIPGEPLQLSWKMKGVKKETGIVRLLFRFPEGVSLINSAYVDKVTADRTLTLLVNDDKSGSLTLNVDSTATFPFYINTEVLVEGDKEVMNSDSVYVNSAGLSAIQGKANTIKPSSGKVQLDISEDALDEDLVFDIRPPSPNKAPAYSLSLDPVEVIAVGKKSKKNVTQFKKPIQLDIRYQDDDLLKSWKEEDLQIFYYNEEAREWFPMATRVDPKTNTLTTETDHLTVFDYKATSWQGYVPPSVDSFQVSEYTGAASYSVDLWTPPGSAGLQPNISLQYNSQVVDESVAFTQAAWVGSGWSLDTGAIVRDMHGTNSDTADDTFTISVMGTSSRLLPVDGTTYNTSNQSFMKVVNNGSSWTAYDKSGLVYQFGLESKTSTGSGCTTSGNLDITWRWSLTSVTDINGNIIQYSYSEEPKSTTCANEIAVYPDTITYANGHYRVRFVREARGDYQAAWETTDSKTLFGRYRLQQVLVEYLPEGGSWTLSRKYSFVYSSSTDNQILPRFLWRSTAYTATLVGIQELDASNNALPAMQFTYDDDLHLTKVNNGQGGEVEMTYVQQNFYDDFNNKERGFKAYIGSSDWECGNGNISPWAFAYGSYVYCDSGALHVGQGGTYSGAHRTFPEYMVKPGARYNFFVHVSSEDDNYNRAFGLSMIDPTAPGDDDEDNVFPDRNVREAFEDDEQGTMRATFNPTDVRIRMECTGCLLSILEVQMMATYNMVQTRTVRDLTTGKSATYTYTWDNATLSTTVVSETIKTYGMSSTSYYVPSNMEFRGRSMVQVTSPDNNNLTDVTWFYQNDALKGRSYRELQLQRTYFDTLDSLDLTQWTKSSAGTIGIGAMPSVEFEGSLKAVSTATDWSVTAARAAYNLSDGTVAVGHFRLSGSTTQAEIGLTSSSGKFFGLIVQPESGSEVARLRYNTGSGMVNGDVLIPAGSFQLDQWYVAMVFVDNDDGFRVKVWQLDKPEVNGEKFLNGLGSESWKFRERVNSGTLWLDAYFEGKLYTESETIYGVTPQYDTISSNGIPDLAVNSTLMGYKDLAITWAYPVSSTSRVYDGDADWYGTRTTYQYETADQGGGQYGNVTKVTASEGSSASDGTTWTDHHAARTQYFPNTSGSTYRVSYPARQTTVNCDPTCDFSSSSALLSESLLIYDGNSSYAAAPTSGRLAIQRTLLDASSGDAYAEADYGYDSFGNVNVITTYSDYGTATASPSGGARTISRTYDSVYGAYLLSETNPLNQTTSSTYNYALGVPLTATDANNVTTGAAYDGFGREAAVCAPLDWDGTSACSTSNGTTLRIDYYNYASGSPYRVLLTQKLDASRSLQSVRSYGGLGEVIQSQSLNIAVNGSTVNTVVDTIYDVFGRQTQQTKPYTYSGSYAFQTTPSGQASSSTSYDILSRVTQVLNSDGTHVDTTYGELSVTTTDAKQNATTTSSNVWGWATAVDPADGPGLAYEYDKLGRLTQTTKGSGTAATVTSITYDLAGRKTAMTDPDMGAWAYTYDALSELTLQTDARGCGTTLAYDTLGRLTGKTYSGSGACATTDAVNYYYDGSSLPFLGNSYSGGDYALGKRTGMTDGSGASLWNFDARGRTTSEQKWIYTDDAKTQADSFTTSWTYNSANLAVTQTYPDGEVVNLGYNAQGLQTSLENTSAGETYVKNVNYDEAGRVTGVGLGSTSGGSAVIQRSYSYYAWTQTNEGGKLSGLSSVNAASTALQQLSYQYDANGNITQIADTLASETAGYTYDALDRLTSMSIASTWSEAFSYDGDTGRMSQKQPNGGSLTALTYDAGHPHAVAQYGTNTYTYDADGNQVTRSLDDGDYGLTYDAENRLVEIEATNQSTPTPTVTPTPTTTGTRQGMRGVWHLAAPLPREDSTETPTPTASSATASSTPTATDTPTPTETPTVAETPTNLPASSDTPTLTPTPTVTSIPSGSLFSDGFESGDLSAWTNATTDGGDLAVSSTSAHTGSYGLQAMIDDTQEISVYKDLSVEVSAVKTEIDLDPNSLSMGEWNSFYVLEARNLQGFSQLWGLSLRYSEGSYRLILRVRSDGGTYNYTALYPISDDWHTLGVEWQASSADGANDGTATLWIDGVAVETLSGLDTDTYQLGRFKLGAWSMASTTTGTLNLDNFQLSQSTPTPTPTPTAIGPQTYHYVYDGDGSLVLRIAGEVRVYSPGKHYDLEVSGSVTTVKKYYSLNGQTVAVRTIQGETDTLNWILNDHLGSANVTAAADGSKLAELRYSAFGEVRFSSGTTPTQYQYTGQLKVSTIQLSWYNSRWYDSELGHFVQPDSIIPEMSNPGSWDRFSYVLNSPIRYNDPSGHMVFEESPNDHYFIPATAGIMTARRSTTPKAYTQGERRALIYRKANIIRVTNDDSLQAFGKTIDYATTLYNENEGAKGIIRDLTCVIYGWCSNTDPHLLFMVPNTTPGEGTSFIGQQFFPGRGSWSDLYYDYTDNQMYHFWFYVALTYFDPVILAEAGNVFHEGFGDNFTHIPPLLPSQLPIVHSSEEVSRRGSDGSSQQDYLLAIEGMKLGYGLRNGNIKVDEIANWVRVDLGKTKK